MRKIVIDLYITFVAPLSVVCLLFLVSSIREFRERQPVMGRAFAVLTAGAAAILAIFLTVGDSWKVTLGVNFYRVMEIVGPLALLVAAVAAYQFAHNYEMTIPIQAFAVFACIVVMFIAAAETVHAMHQVANAQHVLCPNCDDSDEEN